MRTCQNCEEEPALLRRAEVTQAKNQLAEQSNHVLRGGQQAENRKWHFPARLPTIQSLDKNVFAHGLHCDDAMSKNYPKDTTKK